MRDIMLRVLWIAFLIFIPIAGAYAQYVQGDACNTIGAWHHNNQDAASLKMNMHLICDGSIWHESFGSNAYTGKPTFYTNSTNGKLTLRNKDTSNNSSTSISLDGGNGNLGRAEISATYLSAGSGSSSLRFSTRNNGAYGERVRISPEGFVGIGDTAPSAALDVAGDINYTGVIVDVSDRKMKDDIQPLTDALPRLLSLDGVSFVMKGDTKKMRELGLIAQDVEDVYPELVHETPDGTKTLNYIGLIGPLVEAVKDLDYKNSILRDENDELKEIVHRLSARMDVIEGKVRPPLSPLNR